MRYLNDKYPSLGSHSSHTYTDTAVPEEVVSIDELPAEQIPVTGTIEIATGTTEEIEPTETIELTTGLVETGIVDEPKTIVEAPAEVVVPEIPVALPVAAG